MKLNYLIVIILAFTLSCKNKLNMSDIVFETETILQGSELLHTVENKVIEKHQSSNTSTDSITVKSKSLSGVVDQIVAEKSFEKISGTVDLVISMDTSGSMKDEIGFLKTNIKSFIENVNRNLELHLTIVWAENNGATSKYFQSGCFAFSAVDNAATHDGKVAQANAYIDAVEIGVNPKQGESPIYWGIKAFAEDKQSCFRADAHKFLFLMSDEDERNMGSAGNDRPDDATKQSYIQTLNTAGIKAYGVFHATSALFIKDVVAATNGVAYPFPINETALAVSLQSFADDINKTVTGYDFSQDPVHEGSLEVYINNVKKKSSDYTLSNDKMSIQFTEGAVEGVEKDASLQFKYVKLDDLNVAISGAADVNVKIENDTWKTCAVKSGNNYNIWECVREALQSKNSVSYSVKYFNDKETVTISDYAPKDKSQLKITHNNNELNDEDFGYAANVVTFAHAKVGYNNNDVISVTYHHEIIAGGQFTVSLDSPVRINSIKYNNQEVTSDCYDFEMWNPVLTVYDCSNIISSVDNFDLLVNYNTAIDEDFNIQLPPNYVQGSSIKVEAVGSGIVTQSSDYSIKSTNNVSNVLLTKDTKHIGKQFMIKYLDMDEFNIPLEHKLAENSWLEVYLNGKEVDSEKYHIRNSKPYAVIFNDLSGFEIGDKISVKYSKIQ